MLQMLKWTFTSLSVPRLLIPIYVTNWSKLSRAVVEKRKWVSSSRSPFFKKFEQNDCQAKLVKSLDVCE